MNENMYKNPIVQSNIEKLKSYKIEFIGPRRGMLACGQEGLGCMEDIDKIAKHVIDYL